MLLLWKVRKRVKRAKKSSNKSKTNSYIKRSCLTFHLNYTTLRRLQTLCYFFIICDTVQCVYMMAKSINLVINFSSFVNMISDNKGYYLPTALGISAFLAIILNIIIAVIIKKAFRPIPQKFINVVMFIMSCLLSIFVVLLYAMCLMIFIRIFDSHQLSHDGMITAMKNYGKNFELKKQIDNLQIKFQCCGNRNYTEWYNITWYEEDLRTTAQDGTLGEVPFSCCSFGVISQCIHHGVERLSSVSPYIYNKHVNFSVTPRGCFSEIVKQEKRFSWQCTILIALLLKVNLCILCLLRCIQTAHKETYMFDLTKKRYISWILFCGGHAKHKEYKRKSQVPPVPPVPRSFFK
ncbi:peripherin-2-like [Agrilus planipennis]|uniref:Peripherin-2-like n=1 Tax=Agrilus planipennis TaxID=224129 RepID=A0A1W4WND9_AGRPL|nr:peripherin-2-like [Agrilus planipennis]